MTLPDILAFLVLALTVIIIARWKGRGVAISILFGWIAIYFMLISFPSAEDWEAREDWPRFGWLVMSLWSFLIYGIVALWSRIRKEMQNHA